MVLDNEELLHAKINEAMTVLQEAKAANWWNEWMEVRGESKNDAEEKKKIFAT